MGYKAIFTLSELQKYLSAAALVAFDFETAPDEKYRNEEKAALDAHNLRNYYNLSAYVWNTTVIAGKTQVRDWVYHLEELRAALQGVIDKVNSYDSATQTFDVAVIDWLPLGTGRPRADVMAQLQELILGL